MIYPAILTGSLNAHHIAYALDHAYSIVVTAHIGTDGADFAVGNHHAISAVMNFVRQVVYRCREMMHILSRLVEKM